jgi:hypothetical protein
MSREMDSRTIPWYRVYVKVARACRTPFVFCLDRWYLPLDLDSVKRFSVTPWAYRAEVSDCDDAAFAFKGKYGHAVGIACTFAHCWNVVLTDEVWHVEPQSGEMFRRKWALAVII